MKFEKNFSENKFGLGAVALGSRVYLICTRSGVQVSDLKRKPNGD